MLNLPDYIEFFDMLLVGQSAMDGSVGTGPVRGLDKMTHYDRARDDEFVAEAELRRQIVIYAPAMWPVTVRL